MKFSELNLSKSLINALNDIGLERPTSIQQKVFGPIMSGKDIVGIAQTGTGKTYAYLLPLLRLWKFSKSPHAQILIIVPTRELVAQLVEEVEKLTKYLSFSVAGVYGGANIKIQKAEISLGVDLIVGTPGRLVDLMLDGVLKARYLKKLVIDEVDEMFNLGFKTQLKTIVDFLPERRQNLMFSATLPDDVVSIIDDFTDYYQKIEAAPSGAPLENIEQYAYPVPNFNTGVNLLELLLKSDEEMQKVLVFASSKKFADALYERMAGILEEQVGIIHSSKSQNNRFDTVNKFQEGHYQLLISTDIIARGLDVHGVTHVFNFGLTNTAEKYVHRIGRTGRAEKRGIAVSFVSEDELKYMEMIEELIDMKIPIKELPTELVVSEDLIPLEIPVDIVPFNNHKMKMHRPSGPAFHEAAPKNKKVNKRVFHDDLMKKKYKKQFRKGKS